MLTKRIIPCLDVKCGQVVKGVKFKDHKIVGDIVELAKYYSDEGADELVFYDITASAEARNIDYQWIKKIAQNINIPFTVGGGIKDVETARKILSFGADKISINTPALLDQDLVSKMSRTFGCQCVVIGMDSKHVNGEDYVYMFTGSESAIKKTKVKTLDWVSEVIKRGAGEIVLNSMDEDGVKRGYNIKLLQKIEKICTIPLIASGGAGKKEDFLELFQNTNVDGALAASVFHNQDIKIGDLKKYLSKNEINIRL